ncbi:MAG: response regulator [Bacteroidota bacterium]
MQDSQKLVIIDDEEDLLDLMEYHFTKEGYEVYAFERANEAWEFMGKQRPDMILCDWMMPDMSGIDFCRKVKGNLKLSEIPFVMVTCRSEKSAVQKALAEGVSDYIKKPIPIPDLMARVSELFNLRAG